MNRTQRFFLTLTLAAATALPVFAYDAIETHYKMTIAAAEKSVLYTDPSIMYSLGLLPVHLQTFNYHARTGEVRSGRTNYPLSGMMAEGSVEEDYPWWSLRVRHHFFDPVYNRGLSVTGENGYRSWEFMLEESPILGQENSLKDARFYLDYGLTHKEGTAAESYAQRLLAMSWLVRSLGHAMHHIQDMAQPQHVRNDQHLSGFFSSRYEKYTAERFAAVQQYMDGATPVFPHSTDFKTARDFWFNSANTGIAQTVNRDFLSYGTNFRLSADGATTGIYPLPEPEGSADYTAEDLGITLLRNDQAQCGNPAINCTMTMYSTHMTEKASTLSIFDQDLRATGVEIVYDSELGHVPVARRFFDLNRVNFDEVHPLLITRAVAYSAGIVNHFFRGRLEVTAPATGPYSVVDHSTGEGFRKIRVTVKNDTPDEALSDGTIRLIAKYHLNDCYKADLTGEFTRNSTGQLVTPCPNFRTADQHLSISLEQVASFDVDESKQMTFTLVDAIPMNATDLMFQVYYTGAVGEEAESFALGAIDVSEPTWVAGMNATDVYDLSGTFYPWRQIVENIGTPPYNLIDVDENGVYNPPTDRYVTGTDFRWEIFVNGMKVADAPVVPEGRFTRLAAIVDVSGFKHRMKATSPIFQRDDSEASFPAKIIQYDYDLNTTRVVPLGLLRSHTTQFASAVIYGYYPTPSAPIRTMPKSLVENATVLVPLQMSSTVLLGLAGQTDTALRAKATGASSAPEGFVETLRQHARDGVGLPVLPTAGAMTVMDISSDAPTTQPLPVQPSKGNEQ